MPAPNSKPKAAWNTVVIFVGLFVQACLTVLAQLLSLFLLPFSKNLYLRYNSHLMRVFSLNFVALVEFFAPSDIILTFDRSVSEEEHVLRNIGSQVTGLSFPERIVVMSNHQIYADWIYIWCIAFVAKAHGAMKIILKHCLKKLPGMQFFDFIFLKRKLAQDEATMRSNLIRSKQERQPLWLVLFPEGTVLSRTPRKKSQEFAAKNNMSDNRHTLIPRATGLRICLQTLDDSVEWLYDLTIGYTGIRPTDFPSKVLKIRDIFCSGKYPDEVHVHIRRFATRNIPSKDIEAFNQWIYQRWVEKDELMAHFYREGRFPGEHDQGVEMPVRIKNPVFSLTQIWLCLVPYLLVYLFIRYVMY